MASPCTQCGAVLKYAPGTTHRACDYCGFKNHIEIGFTVLAALLLAAGVYYYLGEHGRLAAPAGRFSYYSAPY